MSKEIKWSQKLASLTTNNIKWYIRDSETENIIISYEEFPNVPLWGTRGCINYNLVLSLRQHSYPMNSPPEAKALEPFILHDMEVSNSAMKTVIRAYQTIIRKDKELGKRNVLTEKPYTQWMKERV